MALVAEDDAMKQELSEYDIPSQTAVELQTDEEQIPIHVLLARQLGKAYTNLGKAIAVVSDAIVWNVCVYL